MTSFFLSPLEFKEILEKEHKERKSDELPSFPFFDLPDLVIVKILKEFVPVTDKAGALSRISEFKPYLELKSIWCDQTLQLFQLVGAVTPGWYVDCSNLHLLNHFSVDYFHLTLTIHHFKVYQKEKRIAILCQNKRTRPISDLQDTVNYFRESTLILVKDLLVYEHQLSFLNMLYFWIFRPQNIVRWSRNPKLYRLRNNECFISDKKRVFTLTLNPDSTLRLKCGGSNSVLSPLFFQLCTNIQPWKCCKSCSQNCVHTTFRQTYSHVCKDTVSILETGYVEQLNHTFLIPSFRKRLSK